MSTVKGATFSGWSENMTNSVGGLSSPWDGIDYFSGLQKENAQVQNAFGYQPKCEDVLRSVTLSSEKEGGFCVAYPATGSNVSNKNNDTMSIFVNGLDNTNGEAARSAALLAQSLGRPVLRIHNDREDYPWVVGSFKALVGKLSPTAGAAAEQSVNTLADTIDRQFRQGGTVDLHVHSQGSVIGSNALSLLHDRLSADDWEKLTTTQLRVTAYGAAEHLWPPGVRATDNYFVGDYVTGLTAPVDETVSKLGSVLSAAYNSGTWVLEKLFGSGEGETNRQNQFYGETYHNPVAGSALDQHPFVGYMQAQAQFLVGRHSTLGFFVDGRGVAADLIESIRNGEYSDAVHERVAELMRSSGSSDFAKSICTAIDRGELGAFHFSADEERQLRLAAGAN